MGGRAAWDETAVLIAVRGTEPYFNVERGAYRMVGNDGANEWVPDEEGGPHLRVTERLAKAEVARVIDELMLRKRNEINHHADLRNKPMKWYNCDENN